MFRIPTLRARDNEDGERHRHRKRGRDKEPKERGVARHFELAYDDAMSGDPTVVAPPVPVADDADTFQSGLTLMRSAFSDIANALQEWTPAGGQSVQTGAFFDGYMMAVDAFSRVLAARDHLAVQGGLLLSDTARDPRATPPTMGDNSNGAHPQG